MLVNEETAKEIIPRLKKGETTLAGAPLEAYYVAWLCLV